MAWSLIANILTWRMMDLSELRKGSRDSLLSSNQIVANFRTASLATVSKSFRLCILSSRKLREKRIYRILVFKSGSLPSTIYSVCITFVSLMTS